MIALVAAAALGLAAVVTAPSASAAGGGLAPGTVLVGQQAEPNAVVAIAPDGSVTPFGSGYGSTGEVLDRAGNLFATDFHQAVVSYPPTGGPPTAISPGLGTYSLSTAVDEQGRLYLAGPAGQIVRIPAAGGAGTVVASGLDHPTGVARDLDGNLYVIAEGSQGSVDVVPADGSPTRVLATGLGDVIGLAVTTRGDVYVTDAAAGRLLRLTHGSGLVEVVASGLSIPFGVAVDSYGNAYVATHGDGSLWVAPADGAALRLVATGLVDPTTPAVVVPPPVLADPPDATQGRGYSVSVVGPTPAGQRAPDVSLRSGALPPGLSLAASGLLAGTPTRSGRFTFTVRAANLATGTTQTVTMTVRRAGHAAPRHSGTAADHHLLVLRR